MEKSFTDQDWVEFKRLYLDDLYLFAIKGKVQPDKGDNPGEYHTIYDVANFNYKKKQEVTCGENAKVENKPVSLWLSLNTKDGDLRNITKSDIDNAIDAFHHFITKTKDPSIKITLMSFIKKLNTKEDVDLITVKAAREEAETVTENIIVDYFGLSKQSLLEEKKEGENFSQLTFLFQQIVGLYYNSNNPLYVLRLCRNSMHPKNGCGPKIREGEESREVIKFFIFTYIWVIAICRKILISLLSSDCELYRPMKSKYELKQKLLDNLDKIQGYRYNEFRPGMDMRIKVLKAEPKSIFWKLRKKDEYRQIQGPDVECGKYVIPGVFRYENIIIKVETTNGDSKEFECTISKKYTVAKEGSITLDFEYGTYNIDLCATEECHIIEEETAKLPVPDDTVTLDITSDLECSMTIPGVVQNCTVARNGNVTLRIPKGRHEITLTAKDNPSYVMTREVDLTCDTAVKDMLFAKEVRNHSEWWKTALQNIVVLKKTFCDGDNKFVLWDKTVDLPVYFCKCYNENGFGKCETGFAGNLFYVKEETGCYRYYDLTNNNDKILSGHLFTFAEKRRQYCEFTGYRGKGDALVIDKDGKEMYRIFESKDWNESLIGLYEDFINKFEFSDGWAAMLNPDGKIVFINEDWMEDKESTYPFDSAYYPVFHDGWCAVKNGDGYLFLRDMTSCIKADNNMYDLLQPVIVQDNWACISKTNNLYQIINPNSGEYLLPEAFQFIESSHGLFKIKLEDRWAILDSNLQDWAFPDTRLNDEVRFSTGEYHILTKDFFIQKGLNESDGDKFVYICIPNKLLGADFEGFSLIYDSVHPSSANFIAVKKHDKKWYVFDAQGNEHLTGYDDFMYYKEGIFVIEKDGVHECWKAVGDELFNICKAEWAFIDKDELFIYNTSVLPHIEDKKKDIAYLRQSKVTPTENSWNLLQIHDWNIEKSVHTINPFLSYAKDVHNVEDMEKSIAKISSGHVIHYYRHGNLWITDYDEKKMIFSNSWKLLMDECDEITSVSENLYYVTNNYKAYFMDDTGTGIISIFYRIVRPIVNGFAAVYAMAWGFVQINGGSIKEICVREYSEVKDFSKEGYAMVYKKNEGWGLIDSRGDLVINCSYDEVEDFKNGCGYTSVRIGDSWKIIGKDGIEVSW